MDSEICQIYINQQRTMKLNIESLTMQFIIIILFAQIVSRYTGDGGTMIQSVSKTYQAHPSTDGR